MKLGKKDTLAEELGLRRKQTTQRLKDEEDSKLVHAEQIFSMRQNNLQNTTNEQEYPNSLTKSVQLPFVTIHEHE
jgi:hypothetical protein